MQVMISIGRSQPPVFRKLTVKIPVQPYAFLLGMIKPLEHFPLVYVPHRIKNAKSHGNRSIFQIDPQFDIRHAVGGLYKLMYGSSVIRQIRRGYVFFIKKIKNTLILKYGTAHIFRQLRLS